MLLYAVRRLLWSIPVLLIASILVFVAVKASTDPAASLRRPSVTAADVQRFRQELHLNDSGIDQYKSWITDFLHGDLGRNLRNKGVWPDLRDAIIVTLQLGLLKLNTSIGRTLERESQLQRQNATLSVENSELTEANRVESSAAQLGMEPVPAGALRFLSARAGVDAARGAAAIKTSIQASGGEAGSTRAATIDGAGP